MDDRDLGFFLNANSSSLLNFITDTLLEQCNYTWKEIHLSPLVFSAFTGRKKEPGSSPWRAHALVSNLAKDGDCLVGLQGSDNVFVVRPAADDCYTFLGPAICCAGALEPAGTPYREEEVSSRIWGDESDEEEDNKKVYHYALLSAFDFRRPGVAEEDFLLV